MSSEGDAIGLVTYFHDRPAAAIDDYSRHLTRSLCETGTAAGYVDGGLRAVLARHPRPTWVLLQYNPFSYGRRGVAPGLVRDAIALRRRWPRVPLVVTVHEAWVSIHDWRSALMGAYQRGQLRSLLRVADGVIVVRETLARELGRPCAHVPVASNVVPSAVSVADARARLGVDGRLVAALFGSGRPDRALDHAEAAIAALAAARGADRLCVLNLGRGSPAVAVPHGVDLRTPGELACDELSLHLRASDVLLLPFVDGVSTRRGTLMAGLAHGLPVLGLRGANTDRVLLAQRGAIELTAVGDVAAFARAAVALTADGRRLRATGAAGRDLYEREFDWPVVARKILDAVRNSSAMVTN